MDKPRHFRNFVVLLVSFAGSVYCAHLFYNTGDQHFFVGVLAGIFSPAIIDRRIQIDRVKSMRESAYA